MCIIAGILYFIPPVPTYPAIHFPVKLPVDVAISNRNVDVALSHRYFQHKQAH